jgi:hypothetical protein
MKGPGLAKFLRIACLLLLVLPAVAFGDVRYVVKGLGETLEANVLSYVDTVQIGPQARFRPKDHDKVIADHRHDFDRKITTRLLKRR